MKLAAIRAENKRRVFVENFPLSNVTIFMLVSHTHKMECILKYMFVYLRLSSCDVNICGIVSLAMGGVNRGGSNIAVCQAYSSALVVLRLEHAVVYVVISLPDWKFLHFRLWYRVVYRSYYILLKFERNRWCFK